MTVTMSRARTTSHRRLLAAVLAGVVVAVTGCQSSEESSAQPSARELGADESLIIRTDFRDDALWGQVLAEAMAPVVTSTEGDEYVAELIPVDNRLYDGMTIEGILDKFSPPGPPSYVYVVDRITLNNPEHPILVIDTGSAEYGTRGLVVRVIPTQVASMEANLSIGNTGIIDYSDSADFDGIFRGFQK